MRVVPLDLWGARGAVRVPSLVGMRVGGVGGVRLSGGSRLETLHLYAEHHLGKGGGRTRPQ